MASHIEPVRDEGRVVFRVSGTFDRDCAWQLREQLAVETASAIVLDFTDVREFEDLGVALLAHGLSEASGRGARARSVAARGLRYHQLRLFRYFGVDLDDLLAGEPAGPAGA
jgi:anti-anti-sigma regulatory factor